MTVKTLNLGLLPAATDIALVPQDSADASSEMAPAEQQAEVAAASESAQEGASEFRIAQHHNRHQWRPVHKPAADASNSYRRKLTPFEEETKTLYESVVGQTLRLNIDEVFMGKNGVFIRKNLSALREIASVISNESEGRPFFTHGMYDGMELMHRYGMRPFVEIARANPERAYAFIWYLRDMSQLVRQIGIGPFVHVVKQYKDADLIFHAILGTSYRDSDGSRTYQHSLQNDIHSASDLFYYVKQINAFIESTSELTRDGDIGSLAEKYGIENLPYIGRIAKVMGGNSLRWSDTGSRGLNVENKLLKYKPVIDDHGLCLFADLYEIGNGAVAYGFKKNWKQIREMFSTPEALLTAARDFMAMLMPLYERIRHHYEKTNWKISPEGLQIDFDMKACDLIEDIAKIRPLIERFGLTPLIQRYVDENKPLSSYDYESLAALSHLVVEAQDISLVCDTMQGLLPEAHQCLRTLRGIVGTHDDLRRICTALASLNAESAKALLQFAHLIRSFEDLDAAISLLKRHMNASVENDPARMAVIRTIALNLPRPLIDTIDDLDAICSRIHAYERQLDGMTLPEDKKAGNAFLEFIWRNIKLIVRLIETTQHLEDICRTYVRYALGSPQFMTAIDVVFPFVAHLVASVEDLDTLFAKVNAQADDNIITILAPLNRVGKDIATFDGLDEFFSIAQDIAHICASDRDDLEEIFKVVASHCSTLDDMRQWRAAAGTMENVDDEMRFIVHMKDVLDTKSLFRGLQLYRAVSKDVGIMPARWWSAFGLLEEGLAQLKNVGEKPKDVPDYFALQTMAVARDERQLAAMRRLLESKKMRGSRDERKAAMWFLEDHRHHRKSMEQFYRVIELSSAGDAMAKNLRTLGIILLIDPNLNLEGVADQKEFQQEAQATLLSFIREKSRDAKVQARFMEKVMELHRSGMLTAIVNMYARYASQPELAGVLDIALAAIVMNDFAKVKFPMPDGGASMQYLSYEQREILTAATHQLDILSKEQRNEWQRGISITMNVEKARDTVEQARADVRQRIADLKFHFEQHFKMLAGEMEQSITFTDDNLARIEAMRREIGEGSADVVRLDQLVKIVTCVRNLEALNFDQIKEHEVRIGEQLQALTQATRTLFLKHYGWNEEQLASMQAKMDIELLKNLMLGKLTRLQIKSLRAYDSSDPIHLLHAGKEPENSGSCQRYDGEPSLMIGLSGYLLNASEKIIRVENQDRVVVGRAMLKIVEADGAPALFLERAYYRNSQSDAAIDTTIIDLAMEKARLMGVPLITRWREAGTKKTMKIVTRTGLSPYTYSDGILGNNGVGGVLCGAVSRDLEISMLRRIGEGRIYALPAP